MNRTVRVVAWLVIIGGCTDVALEAGDCPGTPTDVALEPIAPVYAGLLDVTFQSSTAPQGAELQRYSPSRSVWESTYGSLGQRDDGTFVIQLRPQTTATDATAEFKVRVRSTLQGCPPSGWGESDPITLTDPVEGTTWIAELGRTDFTSQLNASSSGTGTSTGPYRLSSTSPLKHTMRFAANGALSEVIDFTIESGTTGDVYNNCHFVLAYEGSWVGDYDYETRVALYGRHFVSLAGSTCTSPPLGDLGLTADTRLGDDVLAVSNIDYTGLLEVPAGKASWQVYGFLQNSFATILSSLDDQTGTDAASISGYINVFDPTYEKQP